MSRRSGKPGPPFLRHKKSPPRCRNPEDSVSQRIHVHSLIPKKLFSWALCCAAYRLKRVALAHIPQSLRHPQMTAKGLCTRRCSRAFLLYCTNTKVSHFLPRQQQPNYALRACPARLPKQFPRPVHNLIHQTAEFFCGQLLGTDSINEFWLKSRGN